MASVKRATLEDLFAKGKASGAKELNVVVKADVQGSSEAVRQALEKLRHQEGRGPACSTPASATSPSPTC